MGKKDFNEGIAAGIRIIEPILKKEQSALDYVNENITKIGNGQEKIQQAFNDLLEDCNDKNAKELYGVLRKEKAKDIFSKEDVLILFNLLAKYQTLSGQNEQQKEFVNNLRGYFELTEYEINNEFDESKIANIQSIEVTKEIYFIHKIYFSLNREYEEDDYGNPFDYYNLNDEIKSQLEYRINIIRFIFGDEGLIDYYGNFPEIEEKEQGLKLSEVKIQNENISSECLAQIKNTQPILKSVDAGSYLVYEKDVNLYAVNKKTGEIKEIVSLNEETTARVNFVLPNQPQNHLFKSEFENVHCQYVFDTYGNYVFFVKNRELNYCCLDSNDSNSKKFVDLPKSEYTTSNDSIQHIWVLKDFILYEDGSLNIFDIEKGEHYFLMEGEDCQCCKYKNSVLILKKEGNGKYYTLYSFNLQTKLLPRCEKIGLQKEKNDYKLSDARLLVDNDNIYIDLLVTNEKILYKCSLKNVDSIELINKCPKERSFCFIYKDMVLFMNSKTKKLLEIVVWDMSSKKVLDRRKIDIETVDYLGAFSKAFSKAVGIPPWIGIAVAIPRITLNEWQRSYQVRAYYEAFKYESILIHNNFILGNIVIDMDNYYKNKQ